ncbi:ribosome small subunit-dependent GTPase A [Streptomyces sp. NPDC058171]
MSSHLSPSSSPRSDLAGYGWDQAHEDAFRPHRASGLVPARVVRAERGRCDTVTETGPATATVPAAGADPLTRPCTGDWVALRPGTHGQPATVHTVLQRRTALVRSSASRTSHSQVLAANVDTVVLAVSLADPIKPGRIERMLTLAWESGARPVVVLTKADRHPDPRAAAAEAAGLAPGVDVLVTSATTGEGMEALTAVLDGTIVLLGPSGAGKSTLGNHLLGQDLLPTGAVRAADGKGRHTTAWREMRLLPAGGVLLDTPGLRAVALTDTHTGLEQTFADIEHLAHSCHFTDCGHTREPGCAVQDAIESGTLPRRRLDSYRRLLRESDHAASRTDARLRAGREGVKKDISRKLRQTYTFRERQR